MKINYYGHSCFTITAGDFVAAIDPYDNLPGYQKLSLSANAVYCSHTHSDHGYTDAVNVTEGENPFAVTEVETFHDDLMGRQRGKNIARIFECEGLRVMHLGDLGHSFSQKQIEQIRKVDILLVPVGGYYTIDATTAVRVVLQLDPTVVIPMHYSGKHFGFDEIAHVDEFLTKIRPYYPVVKADVNEFDTENINKQAVVLKYQGGSNQ